MKTKDRKEEKKMLAIEEAEDLGFRIKEHKDGGYEIIDYVGIRKDIVIPKGVTIIGPSAFFDKGIRSVVFPKSLKSIENWAFDRNYLTEIDFNNVERIGHGAFSNNELTKIDLNNVRYIFDYAFGNNPLTENDWKKITELSASAFDDNNNNNKSTNEIEMVEVNFKVPKEYIEVVYNLISREFDKVKEVIQDLHEVDYESVGVLEENKYNPYSIMMMKLKEYLKEKESDEDEL